MIRNPNLANKRDSLEKKRAELVKEKRSLELLIKDIGITKGAAYQAEHKVDQELLQLRKEYVRKKILLDEKIIACNEEIREINRRFETDKNISVGKVLREIFNEQQMAEIGEEARRRLIPGYEPQKMSFSIADIKETKERMYSYRKLAKEQMDKMIQFRLELTGLIDKGCEQFGKAEFLKFISPLNTLIIPVNELRKIKLKHHL